MRCFTDFEEKAIQFLRKAGIWPQKKINKDEYDNALTEKEKEKFGKIKPLTNNQLEGTFTEEELDRYLSLIRTDQINIMNNNLEMIKKCIIFLTILTASSVALSLISMIIVFVKLSSIANLF